MLHLLAVAVIAFVAFYPVVTAALWIAGGLLFRILDEANDGEPPPGGWPGVTVLIPAYNEEAVIATCVRAALEVDYPELEVLVLDDGSTDGTAAAAAEAAAAIRGSRSSAIPSTGGRPTASTSASSAPPTSSSW